MVARRCPRQGRTWAARRRRQTPAANKRRLQQQQPPPAALRVVPRRHYAWSHAAASAAAFPSGAASFAPTATTIDIAAQTDSVMNPATLLSVFALGEFHIDFIVAPPA